MEDDICWRTTFDGRWRLLQDDLWWMMTFEGPNSTINSTITQHNLSWVRHENDTVKAAYWQDCPQTLMEHTLWWKMTFDVRQALRHRKSLGPRKVGPKKFGFKKILGSKNVKYKKCWFLTNFGFKNIFGPKNLLIRWKRTFDGRHHLKKDNLWWKKSFDGRGPLVEDNLWWKKTSNLKTIFDRR